jgi:hypothetical protein
MADRPFINGKETITVGEIEPKASTPKKYFGK